MRTIHLLLALLLFVPSPLVADVIPPGHRSIGHYARFTNLDQYPDYVFYTGYWAADLPPNHPRRQMLHGCLERVGEEVGLSSNPIVGNRRLFAVPKEIAPKDPTLSWEWMEANTSKVLVVDLPEKIRTVSVSDQRDRIVSVLEVEMSNNKLSLREIPDDSQKATEENSDTIRWYIAGGFTLAAVMVLIGWVVFWRRKA